MNNYNLAAFNDYEYDYQSNETCNIIEMFGNDICDTACNSTECSWDGSDCSSFDYNGTYCNLNSTDTNSTDIRELCVTNWVDDTWYVHLCICL